MSDERTYTCQCCGDTFDKGWSDEEANAEAEATFGVQNANEKLGPNDDQMAVVCEDCFPQALRVKELARDLAAANATIGVERRTRDEYAAQRDAANARADAAEAHLEHHRREGPHALETALRQLTDTESQCKSLSQDRDRLKARIAELEAFKLKANALIDAMENGGRALQARVAELEATLADVSKGSTHELVRYWLDKTIEAEKRIAELEAELEDTESEGGETIDTLQARVAELEKEVEASNALMLKELTTVDAHSRAEAAEARLADATALLKDIKRDGVTLGLRKRLVRYCDSLAAPTRAEIDINRVLTPKAVKARLAAEDRTEADQAILDAAADLPEYVLDTIRDLPERRALDFVRAVQARRVAMKESP